MKEVQVVIQETKSGNEVVYPNQEKQLKDFDINKIVEDQRLNSVKISRNPIYYSVQVSEEHRLYSLYNTDVIDSRERDGYSAIHLICDKQSTIENSRNTLKAISEKYNDYKVSKNLLQQNYDDILKEVEVNAVTDTIITLPNNTKYKNYYITFSNGRETEIDHKFNSLNVYAAKRLYAFNDLNFDPAQANNYKFEELKGEIYNEYNVDYDRGYLKRISVGDQDIPLHHFSNKTSIKLVLPKSGASPIAYDGNKEKHYLRAIGTNEIKKPKVVFKPQEPRGPGPDIPRKSQKNSFSMKSFVLGVLLGAFLFGGGTWAYSKWNKKDTQPPHKITSKPPINHPESQGGKNDDMDNINFDELEVGVIQKKNTYFLIEKGFESRKNNPSKLNDFRFHIKKNENEIIFYPNEKVMDDNAKEGFTEISIDSLENHFAKKYDIKLEARVWEKLINKFEGENTKILEKENKVKEQQKTTPDKSPNTSNKGKIPSKKMNEPKKEEKEEKGKELEVKADNI